MDCRPLQLLFQQFLKHAPLRLLFQQFLKHVCRKLLLLRCVGLLESLFLEVLFLKCFPLGTIPELVKARAKLIVPNPNGDH